MVIMRLEEPLLSIGESIVAADWQVSTSPSFESAAIVAESMNDTNFKTYRIFTINVDPTITYYGRARFVINPSGYTEWSNLDVFIPDMYYDPSDDIDHPTNVTPPLLVTDSMQDKHAPISFIAAVTGYSNLGNTVHESTTWVLEKINGDVVWYIERDIQNKESIYINNILLEMGNAYILKAYFHTSSSDTSTPGSRILCVTSDPTVSIKTDFYSLDYTVDNIIELFNKADVIEVEWNLYQYRPTGYSNILNMSTVAPEIFTLIIPANTVEPNNMYVLTARCKLSDNSYTSYTYATINTY